MGTRISYVTLTLAFGLPLGGCGAKSGLLTDDVERDGSTPAPLEHSDAKIEDARRDVADAQDAPDVFDARPDVVPVDCQEAGVTYIYLISEEKSSPPRTSRSSELAFPPVRRRSEALGLWATPLGQSAGPLRLAPQRGASCVGDGDLRSLLDLNALTRAAVAQDLFGQSRVDFGMARNRDEHAGTRISEDRVGVALVKSSRGAEHRERRFHPHR